MCAEFGLEFVLEDANQDAAEELQNYLTDASNMPGGHADRSFFFRNPRTRWPQILSEANEQKVPVTISGARTGTVGGAIPFGGFVMSMERINKIKSRSIKLREPRS